MFVSATNLLWDLLVITVTVVVGIITFYKWKFAYWRKRGVPTLNPTIPFGDIKNLVFGRASFATQPQQLYQQFKERGLKFGGAYFGYNPLIIPVDLELIKNIMVKDFQHFVNHGGYVDEIYDPLSANLFNLADDKWRDMRVKLTPTFTSGKMKMMFQTMANCAVGLNDMMLEAAEEKEPIDIKDILGRFTTDIIGSVAFGLDCNSIKDPNSEFRIYGKKIFDLSTFDRIKIILGVTLPLPILRLFNYKMTKTDVEEFFMKVIKDTVEYREKNNIYRKDFMHLLLQLKNRGIVADDDKITNESGTVAEKALTMNELSAQAYVFFQGGFESSSTTMTFALYEIASHPEVQRKLREEINEVLAKHNGELTYDAIMEMTYMDKVFDETLRKYPAAPMLPRKCSKDYKIPGTDVIIEKDCGVLISLFAVHYDPEYYPEPEKFDPERFSEENKQKRPQSSYFPFGEGPRHCIGLRFGRLQVKIGLTTIIRNYELTVNKKTKEPLEFNKNNFVLTAIGSVWLDVHKLP